MSPGKSVPEKISNSDFFPKITGFFLPFFDNVVKIVFDSSSIVNSTSSPKVFSDVISFSGFG